jgi:predicted PurR-regulated permease PerM
LAATSSTSKMIVGLIVTAAVGYVVYQSSEVVLTALIGIGLGVLLAPLLTYAKSRFRLPRAVSALFFLLIFLVCLAGVGAVLGFLVSDQLARLSASAPQLLANLKGRLLELSQQYPMVEQQVQNLNLQEGVTTGFDQVFSGLRFGLVALSSLAIALFLGLYVAIDSRSYFEGLIGMFAPSKRARAAHVFGKCADVLRLWFKAQLVDMAIIGVSMGIVLKIVGMEYWAVFALLTAVLCIIPYAGIIIVIVLAAAVTLGSQPDKLWLVLGAIFLVQQLEANVVLPRVMRDQAELPEVPLLIFMLLMGKWFGIVGVFVAPALFAILKTLYHELYQPWLAKHDNAIH